MAGRIVVVGSSNTDMILQMTHIPRPGETILGGRFSMAAGGKGANQAVAAARAGGHVTLLARVGKDLFGQQAVAGFRRDGIDVQYIVEDEEAPSGVALIFVAEDGENSIGVASGANLRLSPADVQRAADVIRAADVVVMQLETPLETVRATAALAAAQGVPVILNPAPAQPLDDDLLRLISVLTPNESEAELLTGVPVSAMGGAAQAAAQLRAKGVGTVIVTLGARGALVAAADFQLDIPAFPVQPVDTTAAGDVFNGALAVALAEGAALEPAVRFASAAAACSVTKLGAQPSAPPRAEIEALLGGR
ncbi:MAG: ribokinase [Pirellulaceae bacterium]|jgi:ribokinase|nr:ribokinase [Pirellulaceae bacterium]